MSLKALVAPLALFGVMVSVSQAMAAGHAVPPVNAAELNGKAYLVDSHNMTLYTFAKDAKNRSNCYGDCAVKWPPLVVEAGTDLPKGYTLITRDGGDTQVAYKGKPLYLWFKDTKPGEMTGDGVKGVWHVARP